MIPHIPEEFSYRFVDWNPFLIIGNTPRHPTPRAR